MAVATALSDLTHDLVTEKPSEAEAEKDKGKLDKFTVLTNLVAVVEGGVKYVQTVIVDPDKKGKKTQTMKFPVKQLFADAPDTAAYSLTKRFSDFTFSAWENLQRLDGSFKIGPQDWTTRNCGKVDLSMCIC